MISGAPDAPLVLARLLQLASPTLPIGAYSYSQGLEWVVEEGTVHDAESAKAWIGDLLDLVMATGETAIVWRLLVATQDNDCDWPAIERWNAWFRASRESYELRAETEQMGASLVKLAGDLDLLDSATKTILPSLAPVTLPASYAIVARAFAVPPDAALIAYVWSWLENQVMAAIKAVPLGQVAGQRLLLTLGARIPAAVAVAKAVADDDVASFAPGLALASARHETQYTRLFRS
jgi:urease accessory protein